MLQMRSIAKLSAALIMGTVAPPTHAEDPADPIAQKIAALEQEVKLAEAKAELAAAEAKRIEALGLPKFEGKVETDANTGKFEVTLLALASLEKIATKIAEDPALKGKAVLVLAGDEAFAFGTGSSIALELEMLRTGLDTACPQCLLPKSGPSTQFLPTAIAALTAVAGLVRSDASYTSVAPDGVDSMLLASMVAGQDDNFRLHSGHPGLRLAAPTFDELVATQENWKDAAFYRKFFWAFTAAENARKRIGTLSATPADKKANAKEIARIAGWLEGYDAFAKRVATPNDKGLTPLGRAIFEDEVLGKVTRVVRVYTRAPSGSLKKSTNIGTFFGADPIRITGGVAASYTLFDTETGKGIKVGKPVLFCSSGYGKIRDVSAKSIAPVCNFD